MYVLHEVCGPDCAYGYVELGEVLLEAHVCQPSRDLLDGAKRDGRVDEFGLDCGGVLEKVVADHRRDDDEREVGDVNFGLHILADDKCDGQRRRELLTRGR